MKLLLPLIIALLGLGAGVGAGLALKPAPEPEAETHAEADCADGPCTPDPFEPVPMEKGKPEGELTYVPMEKPFVVPVFSGEKVTAMVVISLSVEVGTESAEAVEDIQPRLRDSFLKVMFRHANSGGFDGSFTAGRKMEDLKSGLLVAAGEVGGKLDIYEVLVTEIARQDV